MAKQVLEEVMSGHDFSSAVAAPLHELTGVPEVPAGVIPLSDMEKFISGTRSGLLDFKRSWSQKRIKAPELKTIDALLDDRVIDRLLAYDGYPSKPPGPKRSSMFANTLSGPI